ncbi:MAG TPA: purine-nucleoside phosphorylase [Actinomycetota bacterium]|nr:purine-nucleoside phosphorylase [Actinomycetota bacterium]
MTSVGRPGPSGDTTVEVATALIRERSDVEPVVAVVLGTGLGDALSDEVNIDHEFAYEALPGFARPSVPGHAGRLLLGDIGGVAAAVFCGRLHYYEGHGVDAATLIPRLAAELGARSIMLTNAAGSLDSALKVGQLMLIEDHLNVMGVNPVIGWRQADGSALFPDLAGVYDRRLLAAAEDVGRTNGLDIARGVYAAVSGPTFETPAEAAFLARAGARAVGMSTVPEAVAAVALGVSVLAMSCITNRAGQPITVEEVLAAAKDASVDLATVLTGVIERLKEDSWIAT